MNLIIFYLTFLKIKRVKGEIPVIYPQVIKEKVKKKKKEILLRDDEALSLLIDQSDLN